MEIVQAVMTRLQAYSLNNIGPAKQGWPIDEPLSSIDMTLITNGPFTRFTTLHICFYPSRFFSPPSLTTCVTADHVFPFIWQFVYLNICSVSKVWYATTCTRRTMTIANAADVWCQVFVKLKYSNRFKTRVYF